MNLFLKRGDFWAGLAFACLGIYVIANALKWDYMTPEGPGPGLFPFWYGAIMLALSLLLIAGTVLKPAGKPGRGLQWRELRRALTCWGALVVCVGFIKYVGFMLAFGTLVWFLIAVMFKRTPLLALGYAVAGAVGFYALFVWGLDLQLPAGTLFN